MTYAEKLKDPRWQRKRLEILSRDNFSCTCCGDIKSTLNVHHFKYKGEPWEVDNSLLITFCEVCHFAHEFYKDFIIRKIKKLEHPSGDLLYIFCTDNDYGDVLIISLISGKEVREHISFFPDQIQILSKECQTFFSHG